MQHTLRRISWQTFLVFLLSSQFHVATADEPRFFLLDEHRLELARQQYEAGDPKTVFDFNLLVRQADSALNAGPYTVVSGDTLPPSGDAHDLLSFGFYWWPNPETPDGLPWIRRDGHGNPESNLDWANFFELGNKTEVLMLAHHFTGEEKYAEKAAALMRTWFIDPATRMNPHDQYSVLTPGVNNGSFNVPGFGNLFAGRNFIDNLGMLEASSHWTESDRTAMREWFTEFIAFTDTHWKAKIQFNEPSNHGTNYDFIMSLMGMYVGDLEYARANYDHFVFNRFPNQIDPDGSNPLEMIRANNLLYHRYNLERSFDIGLVGEKISDTNLFEHETPDGESLRLALEYVLPFFTGEETWENWPGEAFPKETLVYYQLLRRAAVHFGDPRLLDIADKFGISAVGGYYINLTYPEAAVLEQVWLGDSNVDGKFDTSDLVLAVSAGKYEIEAEANWEEGDWNRDGFFDTADFVDAWKQGGYENGLLAATTVPEPSSGLLILVVLTWSILSVRRSL